MQTTDILNALPASLQWMVLFRLRAIRTLASEERIKRMYFLDERVDLQPYSHVILSSSGRFLAPDQGTQLQLVDRNQIHPWSHTGPTLSSQFKQQLEIFPPDEADCLGFGFEPPLPPVLLHLKVIDRIGHAQAVFRREPSQASYELLKAVGVEYRGGYPRGDSFVASFLNRLNDHIDSAASAQFTRTANCNRFFLKHGEIDPELETGLIMALRGRIASGQRRASAAAAGLGVRACREPLAMTCQPPPPGEPFPYGDLVPLGFLLSALQQTHDEDAAPARDALRQKLQDACRGGLWAFHTGRLLTSTDSVLIRQAFSDGDGIDALEQFSDGNGAYYPQLWAETRQPGRMVITDENRHWCQPDFATTCLVRGLRTAAGLPALTPLHYLETHFENRSGLYFANPYLVDWALAQAIRDDPEAAELRSRLLDEVLSSRNADYSFGTRDTALSTSLAILTLAMLGYRGRSLCLSQLRLLDFMGSDGVWPESTPFYSTFRTRRGTVDSPQTIDCDGVRLELSLYRDTHRIIGSALALMALGEAGCPERNDTGSRTRVEAHPRYRCARGEEYIAGFASRPYMVTGSLLQ